MVDKNIQKHLDKLEKDLLQLPNVTKVEYDLLGYNDGMHGPITLVSYDIPITGEPAEYFSTLRKLKKQVLEIFKQNGVEVELDEFEDNDTYFYIVSYNTNWDSEKLTELYDPMEGKGADLAHDLAQYMQEYDWYEYVDQYAEDEEAFNDMLDTLSDKDRRQDTMIWFEDVIEEMKENGDTNLEWTQKLLDRLKEFDKEMDKYELDNLNEAKSFEDYEEEIYYLQDVIDDYERNGRGTEAGYKYAVNKLNKINSLLNENKQIKNEDYNYEEYLAQEKALSDEYATRLKNDINDNIVNNFNYIKDLINEGDDKEYIEGFYYPSKAINVIKNLDRRINLNSYMDLTVVDVLNMIDEADTVEDAIDNLFTDYKPDSALAWGDNFLTLLKKVEMLEAKFKDKVKAIKKSLKKNDKRLSDETAQKSAEKIAGSMIKNESTEEDTKYVVCSYYDDKFRGLESQEEFMTNDWDKVVEFAHEKLIQGNVVEIGNVITGKYKQLYPDSYEEDFNGEFILQPQDLEESKSLKTEGAGAGYEISGEIVQADVNDFKIIEESKNDYNDSIYKLNCDIDVEIDDLHFSSYYYGSKLDFTTGGKLTSLTIEDNGNNEEEPELTKGAIQDALDGASFKEVLGGGWAHVTFDGNITGEFDGNVYADFYVSNFTMKLTNKEVVRFIDEKVSGEVDETTYEVFDNDDDLLDTFKDKDDAINYAKENNAAQVVEVIHDFTLTDEEGNVDDDPSFETVWSVEDLDESLVKKHNKTLKEGFGIHNFSDEFIQNICNKLITYLWIDIDDIDYDKNGIITFKYNGNTFYAEPKSLYQIDVYDANKNKIGYGLRPEEIKLELFTDFDEDDYRYRLVGGKYARDYGDEYTRAEAKRLPICLPDTVSNPAWRKELQNQLQFKGYLGPMFDGYNDEGQPIIRYETQEVYDTLSESKKQEREARGQVEISESKQKFIDYCNGKIEDLGEVETTDLIDDEETDVYRVAMHSPEIRQFKDVKVLLPNNGDENFIVVDKNNKIVINTLMIDVVGYATRLEFDKIDRQFYNELIEFWDDGNFDEYFIESKELDESILFNDKDFKNIKVENFINDDGIEIVDDEDSGFTYAKIFVDFFVTDKENAENDVNKFLNKYQNEIFGRDITIKSMLDYLDSWNYHTHTNILENKLNNISKKEEDIFDDVLSGDATIGVYDDTDERNLKDRYKEPTYAKRNKIRDYKNDKFTQRPIRDIINKGTTHVDYEKMPNERVQAYRNSKKTEAEDMTLVKDDVEKAVRATDNTELAIDQVQGSLDVLKTDEESAIAGYDTFIKDTKQVVDKELADTLDNQMQEIIDDEKEHIEKIDTIKNALEKEDTNKIEEVKVIGETEDEAVAEDVIEDKSEEDVIDNEREIEEKSIEDYLNERVGQELEVGRLNTILQGIFGMYNKIFILPSDLYNMDLTQDHNIYVVDDDHEYTIWYDIVSLEDGLVKITDVEVL